VQLGPGRSGLSVAIDRVPDKEKKIVFVRTREVERNITVTLAHIKKMAEGDLRTVMAERKDTQMIAAETAARSAGSPGGASGTAAPGGRPFFTSRLVDVTIPPGSLSGYVLRHAAALGGKPAVIDAATGDSLSYAELAAAAGSFGAALAARGFGRGSVLAIWLTFIVRRRARPFSLVLAVAATLVCAGCTSPSATHASGTTSGCVTAPTALVVCAGALPGFSGRPVALRSVLADAPPQAARGLQGASGEAMSFAWVAAKGQGQLLIAAWRLDGTTAARGALAGWRAAVAQRDPVSLQLGDGAFLLRSAGAVAPALAVVRVGTVLALVRFQTSSTGAQIDDLVAGEAGTEAAQIAMALSVTPFDLLSYQIDQRGGPTPGLALEAFALIGGQGPGVPKPAYGGFVDGTQALGWVLEELPRLSGAQRQAVRAYMARTFPAQVPRTTAVIRRARAAGANAIVAQYQLIADHMLLRIEAHTGPLGITPVVVKSTTSDPGLFAETDWYVGCRIIVFQTNDKRPLSFMQHTLAHELGHCMQGHFRGFVCSTKLCEQPEWLQDGLPEWIADEVVPLVPGENPVAFNHLHQYDALPEKDLSYWDYEAAGFFGHVADVSGASALWSRIPQIMTADTTAEGLAAAAGSNAPEVYDTWGGSHAGRPDLGLAWNRVDPYPEEQATLAETIITPHATPVFVPAGSVSISGEPATGSLYQIGTTQAFLRIVLQGKLYGRVADAAGKSLKIQQTVGQVYCMTGSCNQCPVGTAGTPPPSEQLPQPLLIGLSGGAPGGGGEAVLTGIPLSAYCHPVTTTPSPSPSNSTPPPPPPAACGRLPSLGPPGTVVHQGTETNAKFTSLTCVYTQGPNANGIPLGFILIETFHSRAAAAAFFNAGLTGGTPVPGFAQPVRYTQACHSLGSITTNSSKVCTRNEIALHGYRIDEIGQDGTSPAPPPLPTLAQTNALMRRLLAVT
jgi:hypothetical protein